MGEGPDQGHPRAARGRRARHPGLRRRLQRVARKRARRQPRVPQHDPDARRGSSHPLALIEKHRASRHTPPTKPFAILCAFAVTTAPDAP